MNNAGCKMLSKTNFSNKNPPRIPFFFPHLVRPCWRWRSLRPGVQAPGTRAPGKRFGGPPTCTCSPWLLLQERCGTSALSHEASRDFPEWSLAASCHLALTLRRLLVICGCSEFFDDASKGSKFRWFHFKFKVQCFQLLQKLQGFFMNENRSTGLVTLQKVSRRDPNYQG